MDQIVKKISKIISEKTDVGYEHQSISADTELLTSGLGLDSVVMLPLAREPLIGRSFLERSSDMNSTDTWASTLAIQRRSDRT